MSKACTLKVAAYSLDDATVLTPDGVLDSSSYRSLRDEIVRAALDEPRAVVVDVGRLSVAAETEWLVFSSARWYIDGWPDTPILLVCGYSDGLSALGRSGVSRRVPVYQTITGALAAVQRWDVPRHRARAALPADFSSLRRSRELVQRWLTAWGQTELVAVTQVITTAFVENVLKHTDSAPDVRLQTDGTIVTVAVEDANRAQATMRETPSAACEPRGLRIVNALCRQWGNAPTPSGKTVWAVVGRENRL